MRRLANILLAAGFGVCVIGAIGVGTGAWLNLSQAAIRTISLGLPFVVGGLLLVVGAMVGRAASDDARRREPEGGGGAGHLGSGAASESGPGNPHAMRGEKAWVGANPPPDDRATGNRK
jgi:hypothetical protein